MKHRLTAACAAATLAFGALGAAAPALAASQHTVDVIVVLEDAGARNDHQANERRASAVARDHGLAPRETYGTALVGFSASVPEGRLSALRGDPRVDYVDRDREVRAFAETAPWGVQRIGLDTVDRTSTNTGTGVHVYVLDTGIDADHGDLAGNLGNGYAAVGCKGGSCLAAWDDDHGHGTHVAGTVGALDNSQDVIGVAPGVTLHAVKVLDSNGSGSLSGVIAGIDWVAAETAGLGVPTVANMSLGGSGSKSGTCSATGFTGTSSYHQAICSATRAGTVFAVAAGNSDVDAAGAIPAAYDDAVITVSATQEGDDWPYWSNWGNDSAAWTSAKSAPVAVAAPGRSIVSTRVGGGTTTMSGTSMAAPHVAGALALYLEANPQARDYTAFTNARAALLGEADPTSLWSNTSGNPHAEPFLDVRTWAPLTTEPIGEEPAATDDVPTVAVTDPQGGTTVSGIVTVTADATDAEGIAQVEFFVDGVSIGTDTTAADGWAAAWDTREATNEGHTVTATATEGGTSPQTASASVTVTVSNTVAEPQPEPEPVTISLNATGYKVKGVKHADLRWSGATSTDVDVYVDGRLAGPTENDGAATVNLNSKGGGTHRFRVCEAGTTTCSGDVSVTY